MTSNVGTEYINLKKAKYNRNMSTKRVPADVPSSVKAAYPAVKAQKPVSEHIRHTEPHRRPSVPRTPAPAYAAVAHPVSHKVSLPSVGSDSLTDGLLSDVIDSVGKAIAAERKKKARERASEAKYVKKSVKAVTPFPISFIGYTLVFAAIAMFLVLGNTRINEATLRVDTLKSTLAAEKERSELLSSALSERKDIGYIENYAENVLGMVKSTDVAKHYVTISGEDKIAVCGTSVSALSSNPEIH